MFGRRIVGSRDCIQLSEEVYRITKARLNPNTLRRFFGLVKTRYSPSSATIQILCNYCGVLSVADIENQGRENKNELNLPVNNSLLLFLVNLFKDTPVENKKSATFRSIVKQTIFFLNQQPVLVEEFQLKIAKTKNGQDYYFEEFVHIDKLNSYYGNGLRYYLNEKRDPEAQIFAQSLLVFRYWLAENTADMERHFNELASLDFHTSLSCSTSGRYFACLLYHDHATGGSPANTIQNISRHNITLEDFDITEQIMFEVIITEALVLTGNFEEGICYGSLALKKIQGIQHMEDSFVHSLYLLQAFAMYNTGDHKNAAAMYELIRPSTFSFLHKKLQTILYRFLTEKLKKKNDLCGNHLEELIRETGFTRLRHLRIFESAMGENA
jgi:hypothetical protein